VVGVAHGPDDAVSQAAEAAPQVVLADLALPGDSGIDAVRRLGEAAPEARIVVLAADQGDLMLARAVEAGAVGIVSKFEPVESVARAVRGAAAGEPLLSAEERRRLLRRLRHRRAERATAQQRADRLTARETEILQLMADGARPEQIAMFLGISVATLRTHVQNVLTKLGVHSKTEALAFAIRHGKVSARP
ncbi:MAG: response regulator transcription factor, partial [Actinomycetota bacterium]|nr:response regulator transcription factor [Actinomycetota bacterium]